MMRAVSATLSSLVRPCFDKIHNGAALLCLLSKHGRTKDDKVADTALIVVGASVLR